MASAIRRIKEKNNMGFMSEFEFNKIMFKAFGIKKPELNDIKAEILKYNEQSVQMSDVQRYEQLKVIRTVALNYIKKYPNSGRNSAIKEIILKRVQEEIVHLILTEAEIPKKLHFVWVGGNLPEVTKQYISLWKMVNEDYTASIWFDSRILLINTLKKAILKRCYDNAILSNEEKVRTQNYTHHDFINETAGPIYEERLKFIRLYNELKETNTINEIVIQFLTSETYGYGRDTGELQESYDAALAAMTELEAKDISTTELLVTNGLESFYLREAVYNQNLAGASDMVRMAVLIAEGGLYLDVDMLPAVNKSLFESVPDPLKFDSGMWERIYLESIMKWKPDLITDYTTKTYDIVTQEMKDALQAVVEENAVANLFSQLKDINCSPLAMKITIDIVQLKDNAEGKRVGNNVLASHPDSVLGKLMIQNMIHNYSVLDDLYKNVSLESDYKQAITMIDLAFGIRGAEIDGLYEFEYLSHLLTYINVGLQIDADATMELTGPGNVIKSVNNFFLPGETEYDTEAGQKVILLKLSDDKISLKTEEEGKSSWILREDQVKVLFNSVKKNLLEGALDYDEALDFSEWSLPDLEMLKERISNNNWVSTKPEEGRIIVQMQGDSISKEAATNLFSKYAEKAIYVINNPQGMKSIYLDAETNELVLNDNIVFPVSLRNRKAITMTVVGHGGGDSYSRNFASMTANELKDSLQPILSEADFYNENTIPLSVNLLGCSMHNDREASGTSYPEQLLMQLYHSLSNHEIWNRSKLLVSANQFDVRINENGKKEILDYSGNWVTKEDVLMRDQLGKRYFKYNEITEKIEALTNNAPVLERIMHDAYSTMVDAETVETLKFELLNGFLIGETELRKALKWDVKAVENGEQNLKLKQLIRGISLTEELSDNLYTILKEKQLTDSDTKYYLDLESVSVDEETGNYQMRLFNMDSDEIIMISTENPLFFQYKNLISQQVLEFKNGVDNLTETHIARKINLSESQNATTMNAAFFLQSLLEFKTQYNNLHNLDNTVRVQIYAQLFRNGVGTLQSAAEVSKLIAEANGTNIKLLDSLSSGLSSVAVILDGVILTSLIFELKYTSDPRKRAALETQIGIVSTNLALNAGSIGASMVGASTAATVLGYLAVPVAGISIGLPTLIDNLYVLRQSFLDSVRYFGHLWEVQKIYPYDEEKNASIPADDIIITEVDFVNKKYHLGEFFMYSMTSGWGHTESEIDDFYTAPNPDPYGEAINVYKAINFVPDDTFPDQDVVVLPGALNRRMHYEMYVETSVDIPLDTDDQLLKYGIQVLNNIKFSYKGKFYWRYYALGGYYGITKLAPVYSPTEIKVKMDKKTRTLIIPHNSLREARGNLKYTFTGGGGQYTVVAPPEYVEIQFELEKGDVWTVNTDYFVHKTEIDEAGNLILKDEFIENMSPLKISAVSDLKTIHIGTGELTWRGDLNQTVYLHIRIAGELVQMLLAVNLESNSITAAFSGNFEDIIANRDKIVTAIQTLNVKEITNASIQFMSSNEVSGCIHVKDNNLIVAAVQLEEDGKKIYTIYGNAEEQDRTKYLYSVEPERNVLLSIKDETIVIMGDFAYEGEIAEYMVTMDSGYNKSLTSLRLFAKATDNIMTTLPMAEDKDAAIKEWLAGTAFAQYIPDYSIPDLFTLSCTDKDGIYIEYTLTKSEDAQILKSYAGTWKDSGAVYTIFNNGRSHLIISQDSMEDMYGDVFGGYYIKPNIIKNRFIDDIIMLPSKGTYYTSIEPFEAAEYLPAIYIAATNREKISYIIEIFAGRENFVWSHVENDLILYNNVDEPAKATVKLRFMDAFEGDSLIRDTLYIKFTDKEKERIIRNRLSFLITILREVEYQE